MKRFKAKSRRTGSLILALIAMLVMAMPAAVFADEEAGTDPGKGIVEISFDGVEGETYYLYRVGELDAETNTYVPVAPFDKYKIDFKTDTAAATLKEYAVKDNAEPQATALTDAKGIATFADLEDGAYLILGAAIEKNGYTYTTNPILLSVPSEGEKSGSRTREIRIEGKFEKKPVVTPQPEKTSLSVEKIWDDNNSTTRPTYITVQLVRAEKNVAAGKTPESKVMEEKVLNKDNNWKYEWKELDAKYDWSVVEKTVPTGYTVSIDKTSGKTVIKNTKKTTTPTPTPTTTRTTTTGSFSGGSTLPQTGQLWWPVMMLICAGLLSMIIGMLILRTENR